MKAGIPTPTIHGTPVPALEVCIRFEKGRGYLAIVRDAYEERGRSKHCPTLLAAARLVAESLEAAK
jgi:hypothetical protein